MAGGTFYHRLAGGGLGRLAHALQRIVFGQKADDRRAAAVAGTEGGGDACDARFYGEALFTQKIAEQPSGEGLLVFDLRMIPDGVAELDQACLFPADGGNGFGFGHDAVSFLAAGIQFRFPFLTQSPKLNFGNDFGYFRLDFLLCTYLTAKKRKSQGGLEEF